MKNAFLFHVKSSSRSLDISVFCPSFFGKQLDKKVEANFKIYDVIDWETNNYNTHMAQYLKK